MAEAKTTGTSLVVELPDGRRFLIAEIAIDCGVCGQHSVRIAGHHLRAIREFLTATIDEYPELCLKAGDVHALETLRYEARANAPETS